MGGGIDTVHLENGLGDIKPDRDDGRGSGSLCGCVDVHTLPHSDAERGLSMPSNKWAVQRARYYMTLETIAPLSDDPLASLPALAS
jgi:hypothetical protein